MNNNDELQSIRVKIEDPEYMYSESPREYKFKVKELLEASRYKDEIIAEVINLKKHGACSFVPYIAGFMLDAGLLGDECKEHIDMLLQVIDEMKGG